MTDAKINRCDWSTRSGELMERYHDKEWGVPLFNDRKIFEFLVLESAQAGLSWLIVLRKREGYKKAFSNFDFNKVAHYTAHNIERLVKNLDIIRNRAKIEAAINNAKRFLEIRKEFGTFSKYAWQFVSNKPLVHNRKKMTDIPAKTNEAELWAKDLKKRGFKFLGATVMYAHMQTTGMVNDHVVNCFRFKEVTKK